MFFYFVKDRSWYDEEASYLVWLDTPDGQEWLKTRR